MNGSVRIGISGWTYAGWRGRFYPRGLRHSAELAFASREFATIEINGTYYSLQRPEAFARWYDETPPGFVFAVKGSRFITHLKQLHDITTPLANFSPQGSCVSRKNSDRFCGSSRRVFALSRIVSSRFWRPCRATPKRRQRLP